MGNKSSKNQQSYRRRAFTTVGEDEDSELSDDAIPSTPRVFKMLLLGDDGTGKTSFAQAIKGDEFSAIYNMTIGVSFVSCSTSLDDKILKTQMFDSPGHLRYKDIIKPYYRNAMGILVFFDVTEEKTFLNVTRWLKDVANNSVPNVPIVLVGNKCDLASQRNKRSVSYQRAKEFADSSNLPYMEISCKDGTNVEFTHVSLLALIKKRTRDVTPIKSPYL